MASENHTDHQGAHGDQSHGHSPHLQHHFDSLEQQLSAGKLGMWLFLATEILLFGGLFVAYAVYRANHPEIFIWAHHFLDTTWGAINTVVLIVSSFTMALGVRASQLGQKKLLVACLALTLCGGFGFLGIKYVEYKHKFEHGLKWGTEYNPDEHIIAEAMGYADHGDHGDHGDHDAAHSEEDDHEAAPESGVHEPPQPASAATQVADSTAAVVERSMIPDAAPQPGGAILDPGARDASHVQAEPKNVHLFFSVYFLMTGLHGIHVVIGMLCIAWVLIRSIKGHFSPEYYTPVDLVGLYWHLVDLIWIYLFPLLYLIG